MKKMRNGFSMRCSMVMPSVIFFQPFSESAGKVRGNKKLRSWRYRMDLPERYHIWGYMLETFPGYCWQSPLKALCSGGLDAWH
jgi:hypothetical protein